MLKVQMCRQMRFAYMVSTHMNAVSKMDMEDFAHVKIRRVLSKEV